MRNDALLNHEVNKKFEEILAMSTDEFRSWAKQLREVVVDLWIIKVFLLELDLPNKKWLTSLGKMPAFPVREFLKTDLLTHEKDVLRNTSVIGNAVNDFFPTMMKTKITYSTKDKVKSIYDFFSKDELYETFVTYATRHFKRDSFYHYSAPIASGDICDYTGIAYHVTDSSSFINWYNSLDNPSFNYWLGPIKKDKIYTGYNQELKTRKNLLVDDKEIRVYKYGQKLFPRGLKAFRVSFCQYAVNFPPLTAKYLYERYLPESTDVLKIYDPSMGWAGRLLGALSIDTRRKVKYIGTDPNTDHIIGNTTKYHMVADFFNQHVRQEESLFPEEQDFEIFQLGSEVIGNDPKFQNYKFDIVFTSPPYFAKEVYSADDTQSCNKFDTYKNWRDNFLLPTLVTAVTQLKTDRYLLWNIADAKFGKDMLPLEQDSIDILTSLGMKFVTKLKMTLAPITGANRFDDSGETEEVESGDLFGSTSTVSIATGKMKNFCKIISATGKEALLKYEPIYVFFKGRSPW